MKLSKWTLVIILGVLLGLGGWYLGASLRSHNTVVSIVAEENSSRIAELEQEIDLTKKKIDGLNHKQVPNSLGQEAAVAANSSKPSTFYSNTGNLPSSNNNDPQQTENQSAPSEAVDPALAITSLPDKFASEEVNTQWSLDHEKKLQETLYKNINFQSKELRSINCKSTICEIKIAVDKKEDLMKIGSDLNHLLILEQPNVFDSNIMIKYSEFEKTGSFYFGGAK